MEQRFGGRKMHRLILAAALGLIMLAGFAPVDARADNVWDVVNARANARAGGPTNAHDAELLERYGCLSGSRAAICQALSHPRYTRRVPRRYRYRPRRRQRTAASARQS